MCIVEAQPRKSGMARKAKKICPSVALPHQSNKQVTESRRPFYRVPFAGVLSTACGNVEDRTCPSRKTISLKNNFLQGNYF
jgi:hypothetical protein